MGYKIKRFSVSYKEYRKELKDLSFKDKMKYNLKYTSMANRPMLDRYGNWDVEMRRLKKFKGDNGYNKN